jgi:hypothetical protein
LATWMRDLAIDETEKTMTANTDSYISDDRLEELRWAAVTSHFEDTARALVELQERRARGTFACPQCGKAAPHAHAPDARAATVRRLVETFRTSPSQSEAWDAVDRLAALALEGT